ncbi:uncharacterized protein LOC141915001 [Tubulanus polymorphus]|uniref:uncharacterized protein LOC141915001 n=1 Tax=Tubulanus polymorphus TaxID=672921 RepID=UPI003DA1F057
MIPRFRFGSPGNRAGAWKKKVNFLYFFFAWNAFGLVLYDLYKKNAPKDSEWAQLSSVQKYLRLVDIHSTDGGVIYKKYEGLGMRKVEERETTIDELKAGK